MSWPSTWSGCGTLGPQLSNSVVMLASGTLMKFSLIGLPSSSQELLHYTEKDSRGSAFEDAPSSRPVVRQCPRDVVFAGP